MKKKNSGQIREQLIACFYANENKSVDMGANGAAEEKGEFLKNIVR